VWWWGARERERESERVTMEKKLTIAVLQHNLTEMTLRCLTSLSMCDLSDYEVIVIDNGSKPLERAKLQEHQHSHEQDFPYTLYCLPENLGCSGGWNYAFEKASSPFVACVGNDCFIYDPKTFETLLENFSKFEHVGAVAPCMNYNSFKFQRFLTPEIIPNDIIFTNLFNNIFSIISKQAWEAIGGFDPAYIYGNYEDTDFCMKLRNIDLNIIIDRRVWIFHKGSQTFSGFHFDKKLTQNRELFLSRWKEYPQEKIYKTVYTH